MSRYNGRPKVKINLLIRNLRKDHNNNYVISSSSRHISLAKIDGLSIIHISVNHLAGFSMRNYVTPTRTRLKIILICDFDLCKHVNQYVIMCINFDATMVCHVPDAGRESIVKLGCKSVRANQIRTQYSKRLCDDAQTAGPPQTDKIIPDN